MRLKFTILGCGSSLGIPRIDGYYGTVSYTHLRAHET